MRAVRVDKVGKAGRAANTGQRYDALVRKLASFQNLVKRCQHGEIATARSPGGMVGREGFFGQFFRVGSYSRCSDVGSAHGRIPWRISLIRNVKPSVLVKLRFGQNRGRTHKELMEVSGRRARSQGSQGVTDADTDKGTNSEGSSRKPIRFQCAPTLKLSLSHTDPQPTCPADFQPLPQQNFSDRKKKMRKSG